MSSNTSVPIITCGDHKPDAIGVHAGMKPEYDGKMLLLPWKPPPRLIKSYSVIYAAFSLPETFDELPQILADNPPAASALHTQVASNSFERRPVGIVIGGGYDDEAYGKLYNACLQACGDEKKKLGVAFFRADNELTDRLFSEGKGPQKRTEGYPAAITKRLKDKLAEVGVSRGLSDDDVGKLFWY